MKLNHIKTIGIASLVVLSSLLLGACGKKDEETEVKPTPTPKLVEMEINQRPYINLVPRQDGHEIKLKIVNIPSDITQIEYELIYTVSDGIIEMEKGIGDAVTVDSSTLELDLLLGTASCTTTCKYKYDEGVTGGILSLIFINSDGQMSTHETDFVLTTSADINLTKKLSLGEFSINGTASGSQYFILLKNYGLPTSASRAKEVYSVFASGNGAGQINSITPETFTKENKKSLGGDYLLN